MELRGRDPQTITTLNTFEYSDSKNEDSIMLKSDVLLNKHDRNI